MRSSKKEKTQREGDPVKTEVEIGVMLPQAKECLGSLEAEGGKEESSLKSSEGTWPFPHLAPNFQNYDRINLGCFSHTRCGTLLWQP